MTHDIEVLRPARVSNRVHHLLGLALMALNVVRHRVKGYRSPRPVSPGDAKEAIAYDRAVVDNWERHLAHYRGDDRGFQGMRILEIGPGPDLGTGLVLLARGAESYTAIDKHPLVGRNVAASTQALLEATVRAEVPKAETVDRLRRIVADRPGEPDSPLAYLHLPDFDLAGLPDKGYDLVLSHSVLEHLDDVRRSFEQLAHATQPGCMLVSEIDLQTHTRWIRDADPLNIYRYQARTYGALDFSGSPNRVRPDEYVEILEATGWTNPRFYPRRVLDKEYVQQVEPSLHPRFRGDPEQLAWLSMVLCATRLKGRRWSANP